MTIVYALVSRQKTVLAEYTATSGNFPTVTRVLLSKIPPNDGRMSYVYDSYVFHYMVENGICYLCMSDEVNKHRIPYALLEDLKLNFINKYGTDAPLTAIAFSMNDEFSPLIKERMEYYNTDPQAESGVDQIGAVKSQIDSVKDVMVQNIERVLERGEKIELLVDKTDRLNQQAFQFQSSSRSLSRALWWKRTRWYISLGVGAAILLYLVGVSICGNFNIFKCRSK